MRRIEKITRLRHPGVLNDFVWPTDLPTFGRFNLIYGWNGTGKSTLSSLFRCIEQRISPPEGKVVLQIDGAEVDGTSFRALTLPVRVFNRDFVNENVFPTGGGDVPPILIVGKENVERQAEAAHLDDAIRRSLARLGYAERA